MIRQGLLDDKALNTDQVPAQDAEKEEKEDSSAKSPRTEEAKPKEPDTRTESR